MSTRRYNRLWEAINRGLQENRNTINLREAVALAYGQDIHIFTGGDGDITKQDAAVDMLASLLEGVLDGADERIRGEIKTLLETEQVKEQLDRLDSILDEFNDEIQAAKDEEHRDKCSAQDEAKRAKIPDGVTVSDLLISQVHTKRACLHQELIQELAKIEDENSRLVTQIQQKREEIRLHLDLVEKQGTVLETAADEYSLHGSL